MRATLRFGLLLLTARAAAAPSDVVDHDLDAQVCAAAARTILDALPGKSPAIAFVAGGDEARERCIADLLARAGRVLAPGAGPDVLQVLLRGDDVYEGRFSTRLALSSYDASGRAWTHAGRLEFSGTAAHWQFSRFVIWRFIDGRRVR